MDVELIRQLLEGLRMAVVGARSAAIVLLAQAQDLDACIVRLTRVLDEELVKAEVKDES